MKRKNAGFTLIELSIVLVIIGLIVGGVLVGQDLIKAAEVRAQITQIEKYQTAVNTFKGKFNYLPGDMVATAAQQYGFYVGVYCYGYVGGSRDGNGLIDGSQNPWFVAQGEGETALFWSDLSSPIAGNLIDAQFPNGNASAIRCDTAITAPATGIINYIPLRK